MKTVAAFVVVLLVLIPVMGLAMSGDNTIKGKLQSFVTYGLALVSLLLSLLTVIAATHSLADDIKERRVYTVLTKPIRRYELLLGKVTGIILLDVVLLAFFGCLIYSLTRYIPVYNKATAEQMQTLNNEFFTARASIKPPKPDVSKEVTELYQKLKASNQLPEDATFRQVIKYLTQIKQMEKRAVGTGQELHWQFENIRITDPNQSLFLRFKYDVATNPPDLNIYGAWVAGDLRQLPIVPTGRGSVYFFQRKDLIRTFHEIEIPGNAVASDGHLEIAFVNPPINNTVVIFPPDEGIELLYKTENYTVNFFKAVLIIFFRLVFLACLGIFAATFLSFPVAILLCLAVLFMAATGTFALESFDVLSGEINTVYKFFVQTLIEMIPRFDQYSAGSFLAPARLISWPLLAKIAGIVVGLQSFVTLLLSLLIFKFKEIARITL
jgi:hypothetical protein